MLLEASGISFDRSGQIIVKIACPVWPPPLLLLPPPPLPHPAMIPRIMIVMIALVNISFSFCCFESSLRLRTNWRDRIRQSSTRVLVNCVQGIVSDVDRSVGANCGRALQSQVLRSAQHEF